LAQTTLLSVHLWDLRSQAEAKLRCLTRLQQMVAKFERSSSPTEREHLHKEIVKDLTDLVTISHALRATTDDAFSAAQNLHDHGPVGPS
jgi:hypothetical protein